MKSLVLYDVPSVHICNIYEEKGFIYGIKPDIYGLYMMHICYIYEPFSADPPPPPKRTPRRTPGNLRRSNQGYKQVCRPSRCVLKPRRVLRPFVLLTNEQYIAPLPSPGSLHQEVLGIVPPSEDELQELQFLSLYLRSSSQKTGQEPSPETWCLNKSGTLALPCSSRPSVPWHRIFNRRSSCQSCSSPGTHGRSQGT